MFNHRQIFEISFEEDGTRVIRKVFFLFQRLNTTKFYKMKEKLIE